MDPASLDQTTLIIIVGAVSLIVGVLLGKFFGGNSASAEERESLGKELQATQEELANYKEQVTEHFSKTANLVNNMTESYRDVYKHLAESSEQLGANESFKLRLESDNSGTGALSDIPETETSEATAPEASANDSSAAPNADDLNAPKDYAPKADTDKEGTLTEGFGLKDDDSEEPASETKKSSEEKKD